MKTAHAIAELGTRYGMTRIAVACGVFDGVHRGHQRILDALRSAAAASDAAPVLLTFSPHPRDVLLPHAPVQRLATALQQRRLCAEHGVAAVVTLPFTPAMARLAPEDFLARHLLDTGVTLTAVCVGATWRFGDRGRGDVAFLSAAGAARGFRVVAVPEATWYGRPISSTRIRRALATGRIDVARHMLGRPYSVAGKVLHGKGMGRRLFGCPTANIRSPGVLLPAAGVYAACCVCPAGAGGRRERRPAVAYIGTAPTLPAADGGNMPVLETHVFDTDLNLYGKWLEVEFLERLRPDRRFASPLLLRRQIGRDLRLARRRAQDLMRGARHA
jgi:riboflavin kinase/FMN adenylyltransferase